MSETPTHRTLVVGDIHGCLDALLALADFVDFKPEDEIIMLGDYVDRGKHSKQVIDWVIEHREKLNIKTLIGNHEVMMENASTNFNDYLFWVMNGGNPTMMSFDSELEDIEQKYWQLPYKKQQAAWFDETIKSSLGAWKIAFAHHPYISNGSHGNAGLYDYVAGLGGVYQDFLEQEVCNRVDVIIAGHDHDMQWLAPVSSCGKTFHMVSGAGAKTRTFSNPDRNEAYWQADETLGFYYIEIEGNEFRGTAYLVNADGEHHIAHQQTITR